MNNLAIFLFGQPQFFVDGQAVTDFNTRKDQALLAYLAVTGTAHSRATLAGLLWGSLRLRLTATNKPSRSKKR